MYKLDKKGLGYYKIRSQRSVARVALIGVPDPGDDKKKKKKKKKKD